MFFNKGRLFSRRRPFYLHISNEVKDSGVIFDHDIEGVFCFSDKGFKVFEFFFGFYGRILFTPIVYFREEI